MTEMPEKNAQPQAQPSAQPSDPTVVQTIVTVVQTQWTQFRPTVLQGLQWLTQTLQQWSRQLETQEKMAKEQGTSTAQPIDFTPVQTFANTFAKTFWSKTQPLWQRILDLLRPRLPASFQPLSDRTLSGILAGTLLLILWFFSLIPAGQTTPKPIDRPDRPAETPSIRSTTTRSTPPQPIRKTRPQDYNSDYDSVPVAIPDRLTTDRPAPVQPPVKPKPFPKTESVTASTSKTSGESDPIAASPIAASPISQPAILSPDAQKRSKLRQDLDVIAGSLIDNAIVGIRPQFSNHFLTITLNDRWYNTPELTQDKLANSLLVIAQGKGFKQLQLESADGTLLARSPVVGEGMVILQRTL